MQELEISDIGMLILRITVAYIYLHGFYMIGSTKNRRVVGRQRTSILFRRFERTNYFNFLTYFAYYSGLFMMGVGSILILTGFFVKLGAFLLIIFTIPAILVHKRESVKSNELAERIKKYSNKQTHEDITLLANFSHAGHRSSGNKNYMLLAVNIYLFLMDNTVSFF
tara:strand:+ start:662 stop:1162 length:501 start_codon:yes stop_codon:yes gene_type:complete